MVTEDQRHTPARGWRLAVGDRLAGRYRLERELGRGGVGVVWAARDERLRRRVALKLLHPHLVERERERFRREALATASVRHRYLVDIYDVGEDQDLPFLVIEYVAGPTLGTLLAAGPLPPVGVAAAGLQVAEALNAAHRAGFVHRDVTPSNLMLAGRGIMKLVDLGVSALLGDDETLRAVGSPRYLAPEQLTADPVGPRTDVHSLGLVLWEAAAGRRPFERDTLAAAAYARLTQDVPPLHEVAPGVPRQLSDAVAWALQRDPDDRPDARTFARVLQVVAGPRPEVQLRANLSPDGHGED